MSRILYIVFLIFTCNYTNAQKLPYLNTALDIDERVNDLVSRLTIEEKISQMSHLAPGIERLGIIPYEPNFENPLMHEGHPDYSTEMAMERKQQRAWENYEYWDGGCLDGGWWNEALHGVARAGLATAFPQSIGLGSTWNPELIQDMADVVSTEARIHNNVYGKKLTYWSPTINVLRDPRWGRNEESYSEDPYLLSKMAVAFVKGFQGDDPKYLKAIATVKHFVANNSEFNRHNGSSDVSERFLREYYLQAFKAAITEGGAYSVMTAYNAINGVPASANNWLLDDILRKEWGFKGYVVSDCGAVSDVPNVHKYETDKEKAVAMTVIAGTDLECETCESEQFMYDKYLLGAFEKGYINEEQIDIAVKRLFKARMLLGEFDPDENIPFTSIPEDKLDCEEHRQLALEVARQTMVLLKNDNILPLNKEELKSIAVIGPNANIAELGGYSGTPSILVTPLDGIKEFVGKNVEVKYEMGCNITNKLEIDRDEEEDVGIYEDLKETQSIAKAVALAKTTDVAIIFAGTNLTVANEAADRSNLNLPGNQLKLIQEVYKSNKNTVVVLVNGMSLTINWLDKNIPGIVEAWYPGQSGGTAIAEVLFGKYNPGGKLPVTFYKTTQDLPSIAEYDITKGHTYWFYKGDVLYPFGHGLSYTDFEYNNFAISNHFFNSTSDSSITITFDLRNSGMVRGDEVVQLYVKDLESSMISPRKKLRKFERISLNPGEIKKVNFTVKREDFAFWDEKIGDWNIEAGEFEIQLGSSSEDIRLSEIINAK